MRRILVLVGSCVLLAASTVQAAGIVALDGYHKNETKYPGHYHWENTDPGGYSQLADIIHGLGGQTRTIVEPLSARNLQGVDVLLIVAPDTDAKTSEPHYISDEEIAVVDDWVGAGGHLLLFGNNKGNSEFPHLNRLASRFGMQFIESTYRDSHGHSDFSPVSSSPELGIGSGAYIVDAAPLSISNPGARVLLRDADSPVMVQVSHAKGTVIALGDPWLYN